MYVYLHTSLVMKFAAAHPTTIVLLSIANQSNRAYQTPLLSDDPLSEPLVPGV